MNYNLIKSALTNISTAHKSIGMIAEEIFPDVLVTKTAGKFYTFDNAHLRREDADRASKTRSNEVNNNVSTGDYVLAKKAFHTKVDQEDRDNAAGTAIDPDATATELVTDLLAQDKEKAVVDIVFGSANYNTGQKASLTGILRWDISSLGNPIAQITSGKTVVHEKIGRRPNVLVVGRKVMDKLKTNDLIRDYVKYVTGGVPNEAVLAGLFEVDKFLVADGIYNSTDEGQTDSLLLIWGKKAALLYVEPRAAIMRPTFGYIFTKANGRFVKKWYEDGPDTDFIEVQDQYQVKKIDSAAGYLLGDVVS